MTASWALAWREVLRFLRQKNRIIGALGTPLVFWFLIGSGMGGGFSRYFFPGVVVLTLLFTAIFSTISIIEDRREGFLQDVLASPVSRASVVAGKVAGGTLLAVLQALLLLALGPLVRAHFSVGGTLYALAILTLLAAGLTGLGFMIAWRLDSTQGFHAIMNLFLMPLWFLSGSFFPAAGASPWVRAVMKLNPLTYGVAALHSTFYGAPGPAPALCLAVMVVFAGAMFGLSCLTASRS
jgi:ABC-2 type transport system permease protein